MVEKSLAHHNWGGKRVNQTGRPKNAVPTKSYGYRLTPDEREAVNAFLASYREERSRFLASYHIKARQKESNAVKQFLASYREKAKQEEGEILKQFLADRCIKQGDETAIQFLADYRDKGDVIK